MNRAGPLSFKTTLLILLLLLLNLAAGAQENRRPKVGLVLSGGGAKGLAHIGVIKVLEEAGFQADLVTGTSMGSIIGALHSIGYNAEDLSRMNREANWDILLTNDIPFTKIFCPEKYNYKRFLVDLPVSSDGFGIPAGLIDGQELSLLFSKLTFRTAGIRQFDDYPLPFRCVATDLVKAELVVFKSGDLATAMRASMAIPSVFSPVLPDSNTLLVDGGVYRNFPAQEVIDMGADYVLGVYVGFPEKVNAEDLKDLASILTRTTLLSGTKDVQEQSKLVDFLIIPDLHGFGSGSFNKGLRIEKQGEAAARSLYPQLKHIADSINRLGPPPPRKKLPQKDSIWITDIKINHVNHTSEEFILKKTGLGPNMWVTPDKLAEAIYLAFGTLYYEKINYQFNSLPDGMQLVLNVRERPRYYVKAAIHWDNFFDLGIILGFSTHNLLLKGTKMNIIADISTYPQFRINYNKYFGVRHNLYASIYSVGDFSKLPVYEDGSRVGVAKDDYLSAGFSLNYVIRTNNRFGLGVQYRLSNLQPDEALKLIYPVFEFNKVGFHATETWLQYEHNTLNSNLYPRNGTRALVELKYVFTGEEYITFEKSDSNEIGDVRFEAEPFWRISAAFENYLPLGKNWSFISGVNLGLTSSNISITDLFYLGGYRHNLRRNHIPFLGLNVIEGQAYNFVKLQAGIQYEVLKGLFTGFKANYLLASDLPGEDFITIFGRDGIHYLGLGGGFDYKTPLGPMSIWFGSLADQWKPTWYLNFGFTF